MNFKDVIGIDVSKKTIDVCIHSKQVFSEFENNTSGFKKLIRWINLVINPDFEEVLFLHEYTGIYSVKLSSFLISKKYKCSVVPGLEIKRSIGIARGKDDIIDAKRIALYGYRLRDEIKLTVLPCKDISKLQSILTLRTRLTRQRAGYKASLKEQKGILKKKDYELILNIQQQVISYLTKNILKLEKGILEIIKENDLLKTNYDLLNTITGIGNISAATIIVVTHNFKKFSTWRKFAAYVGTAPFPFQSGTSIKGRTKVSHLANKEIKALIHLCALSAIQHSPEMKKYFEKRTLEGKNKMSTINIIRNKLIARVFAVIKRQTPYVDTLKYAA